MFALVALAVPKTFLKPCGDLMGQSRSRVGEVLSVYQAGLLCLLMEISASSDLQLMKSSTELFQRCGHWRSQSSGQQGRGSQLCWGGGGGARVHPHCTSHACHGFDWHALFAAFRLMSVGLFPLPMDLTFTMSFLVQRG